MTVGMATACLDCGTPADGLLCETCVSARLKLRPNAIHDKATGRYLVTLTAEQMGGVRAIVLCRTCDALSVGKSVLVNEQGQAVLGHEEVCPNKDHQKTRVLTMKAEQLDWER